MFRLLVIVGIIVYVIYKIGSLFFRAGAASQQLRNQQRRDFNPNVNTDDKVKKDKGNSKSGEYIDYEEVK